MSFIIALQIIVMGAGWSLPSAGPIPGFGGFRTLYEADSIYHRIVVVEDATARYLRFDRSFQSGMYLHDPFDTPFLYAAYLHLGLIFHFKPKTVLVVGLTTRVTYRQLLQYASDYFDEPILVADVPSLTDDYAPVDTLLPVFRRTYPRAPDGESPRLH